MMKQPSNPTEARPLGEQVGVEQDVLSKSVFRYDVGSSATESPGAYLLKCVEVLSQLNRGEGRCLVEELHRSFRGRT